MSDPATVSAPVTILAPNLVHSPDSPIVTVLRSCARIAPSDSTVLLTGDTGTGKEVFARYIHEHSRRGNRMLVPVNCGAIPETLLESELFGYVKGAFTGATSARRGRIALAEGGTLFLDEIGELPLSLQVKLLRVLQERTFEPVGAAESVPANFRLIAATNRDLAAEVEAGRFRRDLYYRLLVCPIELPALRQRRSDITPLVNHFWRARGESRPIDPDVFGYLEAYPWPGNVRELENLIERISVCSESQIIRPPDLPIHIRAQAAAANAKLEAPREDEDIFTASFSPEPEYVDIASCPPLPIEAQQHVSPLAPVLPIEGTEIPAIPQNAAPPSFPVDLPSLLRELEDSYIDAALVHSGGNKKAAADLLGLQRTTLVEKLRRRNRDASTA